jgi:hypothetical protein
LSIVVDVDVVDVDVVDVVDVAAADVVVVAVEGHGDVGHVTYDELVTSVCSVTK